MVDRSPAPIDWPGLLSQLQDELAALDDSARCWLVQKIAEIQAIQVKLDDLCRSAGGPDTCAACVDNCCGCGRHHLTLTNLLAVLLADATPPAPDFNCTCPFLREQGCCLPVPWRPYNCITFFCEILEEGLDPHQREQLRRLDRQLRQAYQGIAERYPAATLRGLWIGLERAVDGRLLSSPRQDVLE